MQILNRKFRDKVVNWARHRDQGLETRLMATLFIVAQTVAMAIKHTHKRYPTRKLNKKSIKCVCFQVHFDRIRRLVPQTRPYCNTPNAFPEFPAYLITIYCGPNRSNNYQTPTYVTQRANYTKTREVFSFPNVF